MPSGSLPGPLYVLRGARRLGGRTRRYSQISRILARRGLPPYLRGGRRSELATADGRARLARSLRLALEDGGVTFVKLGQVLSTRRDLLPPEFIGELSRLQDDAPRVPWPDIKAVLEDSLGGPVSEKFASFDTEPIAAASIAQVHTATLPSGERVVVKVRRPEAAGRAGADLDIVQRLAARLERGTLWGRSIGAVDLARGFADALREELDLRIEARNMTAVAAATAARDDAVRVPAVYEPYCGERVLVMQFFDGRPLLAAAAGLAAGKRQALAGELLVAQLSPEAIRKTAADELAALVPLLRRLPRRIDRIGGALEDGRLTLGVRLLADPSDRRYLTGLVHQALLAFLAAAAAITAVLMIGLHGGPTLTSTVSLYSFFGYCLLVTAAILAVRVLVRVFRPGTD